MEVATTNDLYQTPRTVASVDDCEFYHTMDLPGIGTVKGQWDLNEGVDDYLGHYDFSGKRVLEIGPASGFLTFHMENSAREVVAVDLPMDDAFWDFVPYQKLDLADRNHRGDSRVQRDFRQHIGNIRNGFWLAYEKCRSRAKVFYGSSNDLPDELGRFDVATLAAVLLHAQSPVRILESCGRLVDDTIIVTEQCDPTLPDDAVCKLAPTIENEIWGTWWTFSPRFFQQYLAVLGFTDQKLTFHQQIVNEGPIEMFTVVASRDR